MACGISRGFLNSQLTESPFVERFEIRINVQAELPATDEFVEIADNGASGNFVFTRETGNVGLVSCFLELIKNGILAAEPVSGAAEEVKRIGAMGALEGFKLPNEFFLAAFF